MSVREVDVGFGLYGSNYHHVELNMHYDKYFKWNSPYRRDLSPNKLTVPIWTYQRCNMTYTTGNVYIVGCFDLQRCFFMKRFNKFTENEFRLLESL
ncbi:hypothetical protein ANCCAN_16286 [Ancylostoma caninum]|uniref:Uncharacterized protein n=1 Tax=Ancylostoma caninum TaxID=29170 RepID=A0A368G3E3_ANCCA|nr:hypothetical protein ANCCAN_16286 [Ancylostoma caninum]